LFACKFVSLLLIKVQIFYCSIMIKIDYPPYRPKIKKDQGREMIFDEVRKRWVALTPEEWVRQNFLQYLIKVMSYPSSLIAVEKEIDVAGTKKRFDIVVYNNNHQPFIIIECKEMSVELNEKTLDQALRYNISLQVPFIVITNGSYCYAFACKEKSLEEIGLLPSL
jgi:hypothetical protein